MACVTKWDPGNCGCSCTIVQPITGCSNAAVKAGITVELRVGGSTVETATTDASGNATFTSSPAATYDVRVTDSRTPSRWNTQTFTGIALVCGSNTPINLNGTGGVKTGFYCTSLCGEPLAGTLYATDANGTWTIVRMTNPNFPAIVGWFGCATNASMANVATSYAPGICFRTTGTSSVNYVVGIDSSAGGIGLINLWGYSTVFPLRTSAVPTCASGGLDLVTPYHVSCVGIDQVDTGVDNSPTVACPLSLSITGTMPANGGNGTPNPGAGTVTITE